MAWRDGKEMSMRKIVLISCVSKKLSHRAKAKDIYVSDLFKKCLAYAQSLNPDRIFVLSTKYGLIDLEEEIDPYDKTLTKMPSREVKLWADKVVGHLMKFADLEEDEIVFLAGDKYRKYIVPKIRNYKIPLEGLRIGEQLKFLGRTK